MANLCHEPVEGDGATTGIVVVLGEGKLLLLRSELGIVGI